MEEKKGDVLQTPTGRGHHPYVHTRYYIRLSTCSDQIWYDQPLWYHNIWSLSRNFWDGIVWQRCGSEASTCHMQILNPIIDNRVTLLFWTKVQTVDDVQSLPYQNSGQLDRSTDTETWERTHFITKSCSLVGSSTKWNVSCTQISLNAYSSVASRMSFACSPGCAIWHSIR
jgi:hypothetical protein